MGFALVAVEEDSPHCKVFTVSSVEGDPVGTTLLYDWVALATMSPLNQVPEVFLCHEITNGVVCTVAVDISITAPTTRSITFTKTSLDPGASVILHTFRITLLGKRAIEV
jgi:hypothetical protein